MAPIVSAPVAMTSIRGLGPLPALIEARGGERALDNVLARVGMSAEMLDRRDLMIPLADMVTLFDAAAEITGDALIGIEAGKAMRADFGLWTVYARAAETLGECLARLMRGLAYHQSGGRLALRRDGARARLSYHVALGEARARAQHAEHTLPALLDTFRLYLGPDWAPDTIEVDYPYEPRLASVSSALGAPIRAAGASPAIVFAVDALEAPRIVPVLDAPLGFGEMRAIVRQKPPDTVSGAVEAMVGAMLPHGGADLTMVARRFGLSPRTLQRRLGDERTVFRERLDAVRTTEAKALLASSVPITEIAFRLGYANPAHFTRAFRRMAGMPPRTYREAAQKQR
ncbi:AraC family transcriptional regulator [Acuticoccus sediminis]|uniref:AraC family transcriptional regulator n=1 Tax=Acuticoccus sediminis TaxID=2184697 RepID=UPI001CFDA61F|nr:AraC family transcriptional regulator [Acuticoccus sediminis]